LTGRRESRWEGRNYIAATLDASKLCGNKDQFRDKGSKLTKKGRFAGLAGDFISRFGHALCCLEAILAIQENAYGKLMFCDSRGES
jgi:hypothetical protein